jgi:short-subunit dehydrogenase
MDVENKVAIVTGASSGTGLATARLLSQRGAKLALVARSRDRLEELARELPDSLVDPADMTKADEVEAMVERAQEHFGRIDILINNAGRGYDAPVESIRVDTFRYIFDLTVIGPVVAMQHVIPLMRAQGGGAIVNVSSALALMNIPNMSPYSCLKRALAELSKTAREELGGDNIAVSVVYPYITLTNFEKNTIKHGIPQPPPGEEEPTGPRPPDNAEFVAGIVLGGIESGEAEIFAHDWMKNLGR